jgi:hypothetical protein
MIGKGCGQQSAKPTPNGTDIAQIIGAFHRPKHESLHDIAGFLAIAQTPLQIGPQLRVALA